MFFLRTEFWRALRSNLQAGLRLFSLRAVQPGEFTTTFDQVLGLFAVVILVAVGFDWLRCDPDTEFGFYGLYAWVYYLLGGFWTCALAARLQSPHANTRALLVAGLAAAPYVIGLLWLLYRLPLIGSRPRLAGGIALGVIALLSMRAVRVVFGYTRRGTLLLIFVAVLGLPRFLSYLDIDTNLWTAPQADEAEPENPDDYYASESILFEEASRIDAAVDAIAPRRAGVANSYFLGFAGHGAQRVFRREALYAEKVFAKHFATGPRSVELINDVTDRDVYPLATVSGLRYALQLVGQRMDRDNDVLYLFITSHGSREDGIDVSNGAMPLPPLAPSDLREALDDSGIQWRVIVVSACYAGVFLDALKSDTTLVITAADAEHNSFGCADDRDLTYFGEALLRDALPGAASLEAAFLKARALVDERENAEHLAHSNPQIFLGSAIRAKLASLTKSLPE
ncbi:MAG: C13 family peptidase [Gammaproteobacteria bacterium]